MNYKCQMYIIYIQTYEENTTAPITTKIITSIGHILYMKFSKLRIDMNISNIII